MQSVAFHAQGLQQSIYASKCHMHKNFMHMLWTTKKTVSFCSIKKYICVMYKLILDWWAARCIFSRNTNLEFSRVFDQWNLNILFVFKVWVGVSSKQSNVIGRKIWDWSLVKAFCEQFNWMFRTFCSSTLNHLL